jgi:hypothetical protein
MSEEVLELDDTMVEGFELFYDFFINVVKFCWWSDTVNYTFVEIVEYLEDLRLNFDDFLKRVKVYLSCVLEIEFLKDTFYELMEFFVLLDIYTL